MDGNYWPKVEFYVVCIQSFYYSCSSESNDEQCEGDDLVDKYDNDVYCGFGIPITKLVGHQRVIKLELKLKKDYNINNHHLN